MVLQALLMSSVYCLETCSVAQSLTCQEWHFPSRQSSVFSDLSVLFQLSVSITGYVVVLELVIRTHVFPLTHAEEARAPRRERGRQIWISFFDIFCILLYHAVQLLTSGAVGCKLVIQLPFDILHLLSIFE